MERVSRRCVLHRVLHCAVSCPCRSCVLTTWKVVMCSQALKVLSLRCDCGMLGWLMTCACRWTSTPGTTSLGSSSGRAATRRSAWSG
jgi:hypothetical protein